jgi:exodeoxyribonuclease V beta subunit
MAVALIEASAGTGKTFTIATLYVRLVLGHGEPDIEHRAFNPPEILVVTFTDAATQGAARPHPRPARRSGRASSRPIRIGSPRVSPAKTCCTTCATSIRRSIGRSARASSNWPPSGWTRPQSRPSIPGATGCCASMPSTATASSPRPWRPTRASCSPRWCATTGEPSWRGSTRRPSPRFREWWSSPEDLQGDLRGLVDHADRLEEAAEPAISVMGAREERERRLAELKTPWSAWSDSLQNPARRCRRQRSSVNGRKLQARYYEPWLNAIRDWAADPTSVSPDLKTGWTRLSPEGMAEVWTKGEPPQHRPSGPSPHCKAS